MEYFFEEPTIKKVKVDIDPCPCCGSERLLFGKRNTGNGADTFGGYAYIKCKSCHHKVMRESNNIGWGDTLEGLFNQVLAEWNYQSDRKLKRDRILVKALTVAFKFAEFRNGHIKDGALVWTKPSGASASLQLRDLENDLDTMLKKGSVTK